MAGKCNISVTDLRRNLLHMFGFLIFLHDQMTDFVLFSMILICSNVIVKPNDGTEVFYLDVFDAREC